MSKRWNQYNFSTLYRLYIWGHRWISSTIANICWLIQTFKYQCCGFQVHFKSILAYNLKTKSDFWSKCPHHIMGYMIDLGSMFSLFALVLNFAYINYSLCQIWSVYMQYLRCCDHSNQCLFFVIQQAEVLLNFFGECNVVSKIVQILSRPLCVNSNNWPLSSGDDMYFTNLFNILFLASPGSHWLWKLSPSDGLVRDCSICSELATGILQSCTKPSIYPCSFVPIAILLTGTGMVKDQYDYIDHVEYMPVSYVTLSFGLYFAPLKHWTWHRDITGAFTPGSTQWLFNTERKLYKIAGNEEKTWFPVRYIHYMSICL